MRIHHFTVPAREPARVANALAEILGAGDAPVFEDGDGHRPELLQRDLPGALGNLLAGDVAGLAKLAMAYFDGLIERLLRRKGAAA